jgi:hypothetical protein
MGLKIGLIVALLIDRGGGIRGRVGSEEPGEGMDPARLTRNINQFHLTKHKSKSINNNWAVIFTPWIRKLPTAFR